MLLPLTLGRRFQEGHIGPQMALQSLWALLPRTQDIAGILDGCLQQAAPAAGPF